VSAIGLGIHLLAYHQYDLLRAWKTLDERVRRRLLRNLAANAAPFFLAWGGGYYLDRFHLLHESGGTVFGPGYTDVTVVLPVLAVMAGASVALVGVILAGAARNRMQWPLLGIGSYALIAAVVLLALPSLFQQFVVKPNELELETPFLRHNIAFTRLGFGLERVEERSYPAVTELTMTRRWPIPTRTTTSACGIGGLCIRPTGDAGDPPLLRILHIDVDRT